MNLRRFFVVVTAAVSLASLGGCDKLLPGSKNKNEVTKSVNDNTVTQPVTQPVTTTNMQTGLVPPGPGNNGDTVTQKVPAVATSKYRVGQKVTVSWKGAPYAATILKVWPNERYSIHYTGWGSEWDEVVGLGRISG